MERNILTLQGFNSYLPYAAATCFVLGGAFSFYKQYGKKKNPTMLRQIVPPECKLTIAFDVTKAPITSYYFESLNNYHIPFHHFILAISQQYFLNKMDNPDIKWLEKHDKKQAQQLLETIEKLSPIDIDKRFLKLNKEALNDSLKKRLESPGGDIFGLLLEGGKGWAMIVIGSNDEEFNIFIPSYGILNPSDSSSPLELIEKIIALANPQNIKLIDLNPPKEE